MSSYTQKVLNVIEESQCQPTKNSCISAKYGQLAPLMNNPSLNSQLKVNEVQPPVLSTTPHTRPYLQPGTGVSVHGHTKLSQYSIQPLNSVSLPAETGMTSRSSLYRRRRPTGVVPNSSTTARAQASSAFSASGVNSLEFPLHSITPTPSSSHLPLPMTTIASNPSLSLPTTQQYPSHSLSHLPSVLPGTSIAISGSSHGTSSAEVLSSAVPSSIASSTQHLPTTLHFVSHGSFPPIASIPSSSVTPVIASRMSSLVSVPSSLYHRSRSRPVPTQTRPRASPSTSLSTVQTEPPTPSSIISIAPVAHVAMTVPAVGSAHVYTAGSSGSSSVNVTPASALACSSIVPHGRTPILLQDDTIDDAITAHQGDANAYENKCHSTSVASEVYPDSTASSGLPVSSQKLDGDEFACPAASGFQPPTDVLPSASSTGTVDAQQKVDAFYTARDLTIPHTSAIKDLDVVTATTATITSPVVARTNSHSASTTIVPSKGAHDGSAASANIDAHSPARKQDAPSQTRFPDTLDEYMGEAPTDPYSGVHVSPACEGVSPRTSHTDDLCVHKQVVKGSITLTESQNASTDCNPTESVVPALSTPTSTPTPTPTRAVPPLSPHVSGGVEYDAVCTHNDSTYTFNPSCWRGPSRWCARLDDINKRIFGHASFRPLQREIILACLERRDVLAVLPTGQGKSLCYHILTQVEDGLCLVISPLVSLMDDQERELRAYGIPCAAIHSNNRERHAEIFEACMQGKLKALFLAPERVVGRGDTVDPLIASLAILHNASTDTSASRMHARVSHIVIDEVHCITTWGKTFRDSMTRLGILRDQFPSVPILALTATVTLTAIAELIESLRLRDCVLFRAPFDRPNLTYDVRLRGKNRIKLILDIYKSTSKYQRPCGIVYCFSHRDCDNMAQVLSVNDAPAVPYYGGLPPHVKKANADAWMRGDKHIICATTAFGMGINKSNVRFIIHDTLPASLEDYHQECGRAGRDGEPSICVLLYRYSDVTSREALHLLGATTKARLSVGDSLAAPCVDDGASTDAAVGAFTCTVDNASSAESDTLAQAAALMEVRSRIHAMYRYCVTRKQCRRAQALVYFGESRVQARCKACDMCLTPPNLVDADVSGFVLVLLLAIRTVAAVDPSVTRHSLLQRACLKGKIDARDANILANYRLTSASKELLQRIRGVWQELCSQLRIDCEDYVFDEIIFACLEKGWLQKRVVRADPAEDARRVASPLNEARKDNPFFACYSLTSAGEAVLASHVQHVSAAPVTGGVRGGVSDAEHFRTVFTAAKDLLILFLPRVTGPAPQHIRDSLAFTQSTFTQPNVDRSRAMASQAIADGAGSQRDAIPSRACVPSLLNAQAAVVLFRKHGSDGLALHQLTQNTIFSQGSQKDFDFPRRKLMATAQKRAQAGTARPPQANCVSGFSRAGDNVPSVRRRGNLAVNGIMGKKAFSPRLPQALAPAARLTSGARASDIASTVVQSATAMDDHEVSSAAAMSPPPPPASCTHKRVFSLMPAQPVPVDISTSMSSRNAAMMDDVTDVYAPPLSSASIQSRLPTRAALHTSSRASMQSTAVKPALRRSGKRDMFDDDDDGASQALDTSIIEDADDANHALSLPAPPPQMGLSTPATGVFSLFSQDSDTPGLISPEKTRARDTDAISRVVSDDTHISASESIPLSSSVPLSIPKPTSTSTSASVSMPAPHAACATSINAVEQIDAAMSASDNGAAPPAATSSSSSSSIIAAPIVSDSHFVDLCTQGTPTPTPAPIRSLPRTEALVAHEHVPPANNTVIPTPAPMRCTLTASPPQLVAAPTSRTDDASLHASSQDILSQPPPLLPPTPLLPPPLKRTSTPATSPQLPVAPAFQAATPPPTTATAPWADTSPAVPVIIGDDEGGWVDVRVRASRPPRLPSPPMARKAQHSLTLPVDEHATQVATATHISTAPVNPLISPHSVYAAPIPIALTAHVLPHEASHEVTTDGVFVSSPHTSPPHLASSLPPSTEASPVVSSTSLSSFSTSRVHGDSVAINPYTPSIGSPQHAFDAPLSNVSSLSDDMFTSSLPYSLPPSLEPLEAMSPRPDQIHLPHQPNTVETPPLPQHSPAHQSLSPLPPVVVEHGHKSTSPAHNPALTMAASTLQTLQDSSLPPDCGDDMLDTVCRAIDFDALTQSQNTPIPLDSHSFVADAGIPPKRTKLNDGRAASQHTVVHSPPLRTPSVNVAPVVEAEVVSLDDSTVDIGALDDSVIILDDDDVAPPKPSARPTKRLAPRHVQQTQSPRSLSPLLAHSSTTSSVSTMQRNHSHAPTALARPRLDPQPSDPFRRVPIAMGGSTLATRGHRGQTHGRKTIRSHAPSSIVSVPSRRAAVGTSVHSARDLSTSMWPTTEHSPVLQPASTAAPARRSSSSSRSRRSSNHQPPEYNPGHVRDDIAANMFGESAKEISLRRVEQEGTLSSHLP